MALLLPHCYSFRFFFPLLDSGNCINDHCSSDCTCAKPQGDDSNSFGLCRAQFRNMCFIVIFDPFLRVFVQFFNVHTKYIYMAFGYSIFYKYHEYFISFLRKVIFHYFICIWYIQTNWNHASRKSNDLIVYMMHQTYYSD